MKKWKAPVLALGAATMLAGCATVGGEATVGQSSIEPGGASSSSAAAPIAVPVGLDTGAFRTTLKERGAPTEKQAWVREGDRMADALIQVNEVDPRMTIGGAALRSFPVLAGEQLNERVPDATASAFSSAGMKVGMTTTRGDALESPKVAMRIGLYRFGSVADATRAFESVRTGVIGKAQIPITGATGVSATEFKPGTVDSYRTEGPFVINISGTAPTTGEATSLVTKAYGLEVPKVQAFQATATAAVPGLKADVNGALARTIEDNDADIPELGNDVYSVNGLLHRISDISNAGAYTKAGVDTVGQGATVVYRTRDAAAAATMVTDLGALNAKTGTKVASPDKLPDAQCYDRGASSFFCIVSAGRWVSTGGGTTLLTAQQKVAAEFTILANNQ